jgi:hypothetical protein
MCSRRSNPSNGSCNVYEHYTSKAKQWPNYVKMKVKKKITLPRNIYPAHFKIVRLFPHILTWCKKFHMSRLTNFLVKISKKISVQNIPPKVNKTIPILGKLRTKWINSGVLLWTHPRAQVFIVFYVVYMSCMWVCTWWERCGSSLLFYLWLVEST